ncbi:MAG TPA: aspartate aminotransferase family protein [Armatimonadota bacterium]|nr:aspartate aminotransferase family protein [Armatimonadota bacterium]HOM82146.1 aspartate aminotransferase family protein [Armatimonadota bacterium]HPO74509.1 aspartate aminotransferase family protein [Armatimonadota bacterium]
MLPELRTEVPGPRSREMSRELRRWESPNITYVSPDFPIFWESASDCLVTDVDGNTFLDLSAGFGAAAVGHANPRVVTAIQAQASRLPHGMGDVHPPAVKVELLRALARVCPGRLEQAILGSSGGESIEAALKTAAVATGRAGVIAFEGAYHGLTYGALAATGRDDFRRPFREQLGRFVRHLPYPVDATEAARVLEQVAEWLRCPPPDLPPVGAVLVEPIQGRGGIRIPPSGWLSDLLALCHERGALLIADEIFTGFGRTGTWFASEVVPDILCVGKAMTGGFPISACVSTPEIMATWGESQGEALHTSTFLGNPLGCAAALAAIAEIEKRGLVERCRQLGEWLRPRLEALCERHALVAEARGRGLMWGLELRDASGTPATHAAARVVVEALRRGVILLPAGPDGNVLELVPPYTITEQQLQHALDVLDACLKTAS